jgi:predicted transcriptional regulator
MTETKTKAKKPAKKKRPLTKDNPARAQRDLAIAQDRISGMTYREIAKRHGIDNARVCQLLKDDEIKEIINQGTSNMIAMISLSDQVYLDALTDIDSKDLRFNN